MCYPSFGNLRINLSLSRETDTVIRWNYITGEGILKTIVW